MCSYCLFVCAVAHNFCHWWRLVWTKLTVLAFVFAATPCKFVIDYMYTQLIAHCCTDIHMQEQMNSGRKKGGKNKNKGGHDDIFFDDKDMLNMFFGGGQYPGGKKRNSGGGGGGKGGGNPGQKNGNAEKGRKKPPIGNKKK